MHAAGERDVHARMFFLRGRVHLQLLANVKAEESYRELLRIAPSFTGEFSPLEQQMVDGLRQKEGGVVEVTSRVRGATVLLDGLDIGVTGEAAVRVPVIAGTYELRLEKPRFKPAVARLTVVAGLTTTSSDLVPIQNIPPVLLLADRDGVEITVDTTLVGKTQKLTTLRGTLSNEEGAALDRLLSGAKLDLQTASGLVLRQPAVDRPFTVRARRDCFVEIARPLSLASEVVDKMNEDEALAWLGEGAVLRLTPDVGAVRIASSPSDADVFIDGQLVGRTPFERDVCAGAHRIRVRHRIGSYNIAATVTRGRTEAIDVPIKPDVAFLGAVDGAGAAAPDVTSRLDRALASGLTTYHLASKQDLPPEVRPWTDAQTAELVAAAVSSDRDAVTRLLKQANANYDAPLFIAASRKDAASTELFVFWAEHPSIDRLPIAGSTDRDVAALVEELDAPVDVADLVSRNDVGLRVADTSLPQTPLIVVTVAKGSAADAAGIKAGDAILTVDKAPATAVQFGEKVAARKPGELVALSVRGAGAARDVSLAVQRLSRRAPAFDVRLAGNLLLAKLTARSFIVTAPPERDLVAFSLAAVHMRFGNWKRAESLLTTLTSTPRGDGVSPAMAKFLTARCKEEQGDREAAVALYKEAAAADTDVAMDDGASVAMLARLRLATMGVR